MWLMALDAENATLKADLHWVPDPALSYVTARVVADAGGVYARARCCYPVGPNHGMSGRARSRLMPAGPGRP